MTNKQETLLEEYAAKKTQIAALEAELEAMSPKIVSLLDNKGIDTLKEDYGTFSIVYRKKWTYTDELQQKEKEYATIIKARKEDEQNSGEAQSIEIKGLTYRAYDPK